jgi:hypothetical protein
MDRIDPEQDLPHLANPFEKPELLGWKRQPGLTRRRPWTIDHQGFVRAQRDQRVLVGDQGVVAIKTPIPDVFDFASRIS